MNQDATELQLFRAILDHSFDAIAIVDHELRIRYWSQSAARLFGFPADEVMNRKFDELLVPERHRAWCTSLFARLGESEASTGIAQVIEIEALNKSGGEFWAALTLTTVVILEGQPWTIAILRDVSERKTAEAELREAASTDSLSGLANRAEFQRKLESSLGTSLALGIIDVDNFKSINDLFGHLAGDSAIEFVSRAISEAFSDAICVSRFGGDEFGVIAKMDSDDDIRNRFENLCKGIGESRFLDGKTQINVCIGVAMARKDDSARTILSRADQLLYEAKNSGRNQCVTE